MKKYLLLGKDIEYSFSPRFFNTFFKEEKLEDHTYYSNSLDSEAAFRDFIHAEAKSFEGINITIPYKKTAAQVCDILVGNAAKTGAVNCMSYRHEKWFGYNTDVYGFQATLMKLSKSIKSAVILGTGGAAQAVRSTLDSNHIEAKSVSRTGLGETWNYEDLRKEYVHFAPDLVVNTTPIGTYPAVKTAPNFPFEDLTGAECLIDLIYNPTKTLFLLRGEAKGCEIINGLFMLQEQAKLSWRIWNQ